MERTLPTVRPPAPAITPGVPRPVLSVFIPARNEASYLIPLFEKIARAFQLLRTIGESVQKDNRTLDLLAMSEELCITEWIDLFRIHRVQRRAPLKSVSIGRRGLRMRREHH